MNFTNYTVPGYAGELHCPTCICTNEFIIEEANKIIFPLSLLILFILGSYFFLKNYRIVTVGIGFFLTGIITILQIIMLIHIEKNEIVLYSLFGLLGLVVFISVIVVAMSILEVLKKTKPL